MNENRNPKVFVSEVSEVALMKKKPIIKSGCQLQPKTLDRSVELIYIFLSKFNGQRRSNLIFLFKVEKEKKDNCFFGDGNDNVCTHILYNYAWYAPF